jgi:hypothetical protein
MTIDTSKNTIESTGDDPFFPPLFTTIIGYSMTILGGLVTGYVVGIVIAAAKGWIRFIC